MYIQSILSLRLFILIHSVYAIEASSIAKQAEKVAEANGASNKINVIQDRVEVCRLSNLDKI